MSTIKTLVDGTESVVPEDPSDLTQFLINPPSWPPLNPERSIDSFLACQVGLFQILSAMDMWSVDVMALLRNPNDVQARKFRFQAIHLDWAGVEHDHLPIPSATISSAGPTRYNPVSPEFLDHTLDLYGEGTVLRRNAHAEVQIVVETWFSNKDERGGARKAFEDIFTEPEDERAGRRIVIRPYFDRVARYVMQEIEYPDHEDWAKENRFPLIALFAVDIECVKLVKAPPFMRASMAFDIGT